MTPQRAARFRSVRCYAMQPDGVTFNGVVLVRIDDESLVRFVEGRGLAVTLPVATVIVPWGDDLFVVQPTYAAALAKARSADPEGYREVVEPLPG